MKGEGEHGSKLSEVTEQARIRAGIRIPDSWKVFLSSEHRSLLLLLKRMIAFSLGNSKRTIVLFSAIWQKNVYSKQTQDC